MTAFLQDWCILYGNPAHAPPPTLAVRDASRHTLHRAAERAVAMPAPPPGSLVCVGGVCWRCVLVVCIGGVYWWCVGVVL